MGTPAPDAVKRLVDHFDQNRKVFLSGDYKEEQLWCVCLPPARARLTFLLMRGLIRPRCGGLTDASGSPIIPCGI